VSAFDLAAFKRAVEAKDVEAWLAFYSDDAEWLEYQPGRPLVSPRRYAGREEIRAYLEYVAGEPEPLAVSDELADGDRAAFAIWMTFADGRRFGEHCILELRDGLIVRHVDIELWDPENGR
jgi:ketosteroid isomerase-like protein